MKKLVLFAFVSVLFSTVMTVNLAEQVEASETIYIRADGSVEGTTHILTSDNVTYTFIDNINDFLVVERNNIVVDGVGYTLQGTGSGTGIYLSGRSNVTIRNVEIEGFFIGMELDHSTKSSMQGNEIKNNGHGIWLSSSSNNTIRNNNIERVGVGIWLFGSSNNYISGNLVTKTLYGIDLSISSSFNKIFENTITSSQHACIAITDSSGNTIYHNDLMGGLYISNSTNVWDDGESRGNYWSLYFGADQDGDGIGDTPCVIDEYNQDNYPLMNPVNPQMTAVVPFWMEWWFWAIIAVVIIAVVVAVYMLVKKRKPPIPTVSSIPSEGIT